MSSSRTGGKGAKSGKGGETAVVGKGLQTSGVETGARDTEESGSGQEAVLLSSSSSSSDGALAAPNVENSSSSSSSSSMHVEHKGEHKGEEWEDNDGQNGHEFGRWQEERAKPFSSNKQQQRGGQAFASDDSSDDDMTYEQLLEQCLHQRRTLSSRLFKATAARNEGAKADILKELADPGHAAAEPV